MIPRPAGADGFVADEDAADSADIPRGQQTKGLAYSRAAECQIAQLVLVARSRTDSFGEDRWIGGDADNLAFVYHAGQAAGLNALTAWVVELD